MNGGGAEQPQSTTIPHSVQKDLEVSIPGTKLEELEIYAFYGSILRDLTCSLAGLREVNQVLNLSL